MTTEERLEKLEKELCRANRRNRWLLAGMGLFGVVLIAGGLGLAWTLTKDTPSRLTGLLEATPPRNRPCESRV